MVKESMDLLELLRKRGVDGDVDFLREALRVLMDAIMDAEVSTRIGVEHGERSPDRLTHRNGYRSRAWDTRVGTMELRIPKLREGSYFPSLLEPRRRSEKALLAVIQQAQVDWGVFSYIGEDGRKHRMWAFVMVLGWSRAIYVEFVRRADVATFIRCHLNAFDYFGGVPRRCPYDNAKLVVLGRDDDGRAQWNGRILDFTRRVGFEMRLCRPYRAQSKGKGGERSEVRAGNFWPAVRFSDDFDLNGQTLAWCDGIANERVHGTTGQVPKTMLSILLGAEVAARRSTT